MTTYTATCRRSGNWWAITIPELKGVHTQARRLDQVAAMAQEAIGLMLDVNPDTITVDVRPDIPVTVSTALDARNAAREAEDAAEDATATAIRHLLDAGYTVRDTGALLHLSPQRISQLAPTKAKAATRGAKRARQVA